MQRTATKTPRKTFINSKTTSRSEKREEKTAIPLKRQFTPSRPDWRGCSKKRQESRRPTSDKTRTRRLIEREEMRMDQNTATGIRVTFPYRICTQCRGLIIIEYWPNQGSSFGVWSRRALTDCINTRPTLLLACASLILETGRRLFKSEPSAKLAFSVWRRCCGVVFVVFWISRLLSSQPTLRDQRNFSLTASNCIGQVLCIVRDKSRSNFDANITGFVSSWNINYTVYWEK